MLPQPILIVGAFCEQLLQSILADRALTIRRTHTRLSHRLKDGPHLSGINGRCCGRPYAPRKSSDNALIIGMHGPATRIDP